MSWFDSHRTWLEGAQSAIASRKWWSPFQESPSRRHHPDGAKAAGLARFESILGKRFPLELPGSMGTVAPEVSPYTGKALGVEYPVVDVAVLLKAMDMAMAPWARADVEIRVGVCLEILSRWASNCFENAYATMHTAGQSFMMAFAGSGANSLDRGLEALALAHEAMTKIPERAVFTRSFAGRRATLDKSYRLHPRGIAAVFSCGTYPAWNAYPAILANLATGNPVVLKPHPACVLPMARAVALARDVLREAGFDAELVSLAVDPAHTLIGKDLVQNSSVRIVDFTGGAEYGNWIEANARDKLVFTETAGCNSVVLDSTEDIDATVFAIAHSICLFSSQMCTSAQNVFVPEAGVRCGDTLYSYDEVCARLSECIVKLTADEDKAIAICGALMSARTVEEIDSLRALGEQAGRVLHEPSRIASSEFPEARSLRPLLLAVDCSENALYQREHFGPMAFVIKTRDREHALQAAAADAQRFGAIASYAYSVDSNFQEQIIDAFAGAGASVGINLHVQLPINFAAAYSDFHVTGLNPAGNACLADLAFVTSRFRITQAKVERS